MFRNRLFRENAVTRMGRPQPLDDLLRVTAPHEWAILTALALALSCALAWGLFGSVERGLSVDCVLTLPGERHPVFAEFSGRIAEVFIEEGDAVEAGQPLARVRIPELNRQTSIAHARVRLLEVQQAKAALAAARVELREAKAIESAGTYIVSPHAGEIALHRLATGDVLEPGELLAYVRDASNNRMEAVAFLTTESARRIEAGMAARVSIRQSEGDGVRILAATVDEITPPSAAPHWIEDAKLPVPHWGRLVRVAFAEAPAPAPADGAHGRMRIVTREQAPLRLLVPERF